MGMHFDDIHPGQVFSFGGSRLTAEDVEEFLERFAPHLPMHEGEFNRVDRRAVAQGHVYALWSRMLYEFTHDWPILARIGQDQLRWYKTAYVDDVLTVRITFLTAEPLDSARGVVVTQHDVLNQHGELVMSLLTRAVVARRAATA
jgi:acyl dehydratase